MAESASPPYPQTPVLETPTAVGVLIANIIIPGLGTLIAGIVGQQKLIGRAVAQFLLAIVLVGWVWSIVTGVQAMTNATWKSKQTAPAAAEPAATKTAVAPKAKAPAKKAAAKKTAAKKSAK